MRKALYYLSISILAGFAFVLGVGTAKSIWGGVLVLVLLAAVYGAIEFRD